MQYEFAIFMNDRGCNFTIQYFVYVANGHSKISTTSLSINHSIYDPAVDTEGIKNGIYGVFLRDVIIHIS